MQPSDQVQRGATAESLDRRIASLRDSIEREQRSRALAEPESVLSPSPPRLSARRVFRNALRMVRKRDLEFRVCCFGVAVSLVAGWLIAFKL